MTKAGQRFSKQDEGYAWVIVFAAFFVQFIQDGVRFSYGLLFVEFLEMFGESKSATAWVGSIMLGVFNLSGPISALIVNKFGFRFCSMLGCVITSLSFVLSYFAPSLYYLYITYGAMQGFGFGLLFLGGTVATGKYFKKKQALAIGISFCGGGIGTFTLVPIVRLAIDFYTWRGAMLILAGISLNGCVFSALFRPFVEEKTEQEKKSVSNEGSNRCVNPVSSGTSSDTNKHEKNLEEEDFDKNETFSDDKTLHGQNIPLLVTKTEVIDEHNNEETSEQNGETSNNNTQDRTIDHDVISPLTGADELEPTIENDDSDANVENVKFKNPFIENLCPKAMVTNNVFIILQFATVFIALPEFVPYSMLPDFGLSVNCTPSQSAWMLSAVGIGATLSQVIGGWLSDMKCVSPVILLAVCILCVGVTTMIAAVIPMLETLIAYAVLFGLFSGSMYAVQPVVLFQYVGEKYMASIMGVLMWVYGVSGFVGTPTAGWIFDKTGSYTISFLVAGAAFVISSAITFLVLCTKSGKEHRQKKKLENESLEA